jgi:hypothetical protein
MKLGIMQPYFLPYIGYFQLVNLVDKFVVYDNIKYTKKGWINRNRILVNGKDEYITLPLKRDSDYLNVNQRYLSSSFSSEKGKILNRVRESYRKAACYTEVYQLLEDILNFKDMNLFEFVFNSLKLICQYLGIETEFVVSSKLSIDHTLKAEDKVQAICKQLKADSYINSIGGVDLYSKKNFRENNIDLQFLKPNSIVYPQMNTVFTPNLSILDVMMFNCRDNIVAFLNDEYTFV